ncbi:MAG: YceI family protein [Paludibacter sp.]
MKKYVLVTLVLSLALISNLKAQDKFITKTGHVWIHSKTPVKEIEAHNHQITSILDVKTGDMIVSAFLRDFKFDNQLVEEHFNENYVESAKYPKVKFKAKVIDIASIDFSKNGTYKRMVEGILEMHGKSVTIKKEGTAVVKDGKIKATAAFTVTAEQFAIVIPAIVKDKIQKDIEVYVDFTYTPYTK